MGLCGAEDFVQASLPLSQNAPVATVLGVALWQLSVPTNVTSHNTFPLCAELG